MYKNNKIPRFSVFSLPVFIILLISSLPVYGQDYRILITNDDGVESELLAALTAELSTIAEVTVSAPRENQSGMAQASTGGPFTVEEIRRDGRLFGYGVHGTPTDAMRYGLLVLGKDDPFDLVVSGINRGANVGKVSHGSGTVGAAMQAVFLGVPAIAVSQDVRDVDTSVTVKLALDLVKKYKAEGAPPGVVVSINVPRGELKGVVARPMGDSYLSPYAYELVSETDGVRNYERRRGTSVSEDPSTDTWAYQNGYVTLTPLRLDWTDYDLLEAMKSWELQLSK